MKVPTRQGELGANTSLRPKYTRNALRLQKLENTYSYADKVTFLLLFSRSRARILNFRSFSHQGVCCFDSPVCMN